jgi:hypothetical protein
MEQEKKERKLKRLRGWLGRNWWKILISILVGVGVCNVIYYWIVTPYRLEVSDKYDIFVDLLVIILALVGAAGYTIFKWIESKLSERLHKEEQEVKGRLQKEGDYFMAIAHWSLGYAFWQLFKVEETKEKIGVTSDSSKKAISMLIKLAIESARNSMSRVEKLPENEYKNELYSCRNNWIYFSAEAARKGLNEILTKEDKEEILKKAGEFLVEVAITHKQKYPEEYYSKEYYDFQETCAWAFQHLSEEEDQKRTAHNIICELLKDTKIKPSWRKEIKEKWKNFLPKKESLHAT